MLFRAVTYPEGLDMPVQYVGCYVLKWGELQDPEVGFVPVDGDEADLLDAAPDLLAALHDARLLLTMIAKETYQGDDWAERDESIRGCLMGIDTAIAKAKGE